MEICKINFLDVPENKEYISLINKVIKECYNEEQWLNRNLYINVVLTNSDNIKKINKKYRNIDEETDVLSFPIFEKEELINANKKHKDILGDIVISIPKIISQAKEYGHNTKGELSYMIVHSFYHLLGYDHMTEEDKEIMRRKEEKVLEVFK